MTEPEVENFVSFLASILAAGRKSGFDPRLVLSGSWVIDEAVFLALWDPRKEIDSPMAASLGAAVEPGLLRTHRSMNTWEAFRVSHLS